MFGSLAREICQNSLDARVDNNKPVKIGFIINNINKKDIYGIADLENAIHLCKNYWSENKKTFEFFSNAVKICNRDKIRVLRISDYNTTGLTGENVITRLFPNSCKLLLNPYLPPVHFFV